VTLGGKSGVEHAVTNTEAPSTSNRSMVFIAPSLVNGLRNSYVTHV
jgi:hypothetical protein